MTIVKNGQEIVNTQRRNDLLFFIVAKNQLTKDELKVRVLKLKNEIYQDGYSDGISHLAHKYLDKVLDIIDEYRY